MLNWFAKHSRDFPWRKTNNVYHILIAEVLLRRTQASRVVEPYNQIIKNYPTLEDLAGSKISELRDLFKSLGLVHRADLLIEAAKKIINEYEGELPRNYKFFESLPGIGIYSSRAIVCMAFGEPVPMIDESSGRVLRRVFNLAATGPAYCDMQLLKFCSSIMSKEYAREFNLDIAAFFCHTKKPECLKCPLSEICSFTS